LEAEVAPPPFAAIVARRRRRTQRRAIAGVVLATVAVLAAGLLLRPVQPAKPEPITPPKPTIASLTPTPEPDPVPTGLPPAGSATGPGVAALVAAPSGTLYAIVTTCTTRCTDAQPVLHHALIRSTDLGAHWTGMNQIQGLDSGQSYPPQLLVADDRHLWVMVPSTVFATTDGGQHWTSTNTTAWPGGVAGGTGWFVSGTTVMRAAAGLPPRATPGQIPGSRDLTQLTAISADQAVALAAPVEGGSGSWYATNDGGAHWVKQPDPCAGTVAAESWESRMAKGPDGTRWVVCATQPGAGQQRKELVVSTDDGQTWHRQGTLESNGYGTEVYPFSATGAWRTGGRADVYRTTDRTHWTDVVGEGGSGGILFVAIDADTALYFRDDTGTQPVRYLTRDGGRTWSSQPFTPPA
jgi:photosystem II stability/assembly factor-like uncharacterized protein